jgi:UDP-N-acetyl-2-amino-2-deoxyglucuronate dehydrogenase
MKLGVGIIGCGGISRKHIEACLSLEEYCEIKGVADIDLAKAQSAAAGIGAKVGAYDDYHRLLERDDIDVIGICTPPFAHKDPAVDALRAGKHVLVEKPFAASLEECDEMMGAADAAQRKLACVFQLRFDEEISKVCHILKSEEMGRIVFAQMNGLYWRGPNYYNIPWRGKFDTENGGVTMNHSIHTLDLFLWVMGARPVSVWADMDTLNHDIEVEDLSMAVIRFDNGAVGQVNCSLSTVKSAHTMFFSSKENYVAYPLDLYAVKETASGFPEVDEEAIGRLKLISDQAATGGVAKHSSTYADLFQAISEDREPLVDGKEARRTLEVITAIYKSATTGSRVELPIMLTDPWYTRQGILDRVKKSPNGKESHK